MTGSTAINACLCSIKYHEKSMFDTCKTYASRIMEDNCDIGAQMPNIKKYILNIIGQFKDKSVYCNFELLMIRVVFGVCE